MTPSPKSSAKKLNFEQSLAKLEQIVQRLEEEQIPLERAIDLYAEGQQLIKQCEQRLKAADNRIRQIRETAEGRIEETPFDSQPTEPSDPDEDPAPEQA